MKRYVALFLCFALACLPVAGCGEKVEYRYGDAVAYPDNYGFVSTAKAEGFSYTVYEDHTEIISVELSDSASSLKFPSELGGKPVTVIGSGVLSADTTLKSVLIPDSVEEIGNYAFSGCTALESVILSKNLKKLGCGTFSETPWLSSLTDEFSVVGKGVLIKYNGKGGNIKLPSDVGYISDAFSGNNSITSITIPDTVKGISDSAFYKCGSLSEIDIPTGLADIGTEAFKGTTWAALSDDEFLVVGDGVLIDYRGDSTEVTIPDGVKYVAGAFYDNKSITSVVVPDTVKHVRNGSFYNCTSLTEVSFNGAETVTDAALFRDCIALSSVKLPESLEIIDDYLFYGCVRLNSVNIPESVKYIGKMAFYYCGVLTEVTLPEGVSELGDGAFFGCTELKKLNMPDSVSKIGRVCFSCCYNLEPFELPPKVTVIEDGLFSYCLLFKNVTVPERITTIGQYAFEAITGITLEIEGNATVVDASVFGDEPKEAEIICNAGSAAEKCAEKNNLKYTVRNQ